MRVAAGKKLQKVLTFFRGRDGTGFVPAPDAIALAGDEAVCGFADGPWDEAKDCREGWPGLRQDAQAGEDGVGANQELFDRLAGVAQYQDCVWRVAGAGI